VSLSTNSLAFGYVAVGTSVSKSVTVTVSGTAAVTINSDSISGTGFSVSGGNLPADLKPGQSVVLTVQFSPKTSSAVIGKLTISTTATTATVNLTGSGTSVTPTVNGFTCASTNISGSLADACTVTLSGTAPISGVSVALTSSSGSVTVPASVNVPATSNTATFTANVAAVTTAQSVTLTAKTGSTSRVLTLQLAGAAAELSVNATSISFGSVVLNLPTIQTVTLTSSGTAAVKVSSVSVTGNGFSLSPIILPIVLNPGQTVIVSVIFLPTTKGSMTGQLTINSNSQKNATMVIPLSGSVALSTYQVNLNWQAPDSSNDPIVGYHVYRAPSGSTAYALLNSTLVTGTSYVDSTVQSGKSYDYIVTSVDAQGNESVPSNAITVTIP
jgi:hypothetical protein